MVLVTEVLSLRANCDRHSTAVTDRSLLLAASRALNSYLKLILRCISLSVDSNYHQTSRRGRGSVSGNRDRE